MALLIEIRPTVQDLPPVVVVHVSDLLRIAATGGRVVHGHDAVSLVGIYNSSIAAGDGRVLFPAGAPDTVLFAASKPGLARIEVMVGDPFRSSRVLGMDVEVLPTSVGGGFPAPAR